MLWIFSLIAAGLCILLFVQDLTTRTISVLAVAGLGFCGWMVNAASVSGLRGEEMLVSAGLLSVLIASLQLYYFIRYRRFRGLLNHIGAGDLITLLALALWLKPFALLLFIPVVNVSLLAGVLLVRWAGNWKPGTTLPLAGVMALLLLPAWWVTTTGFISLP